MENTIKTPLVVDLDGTLVKTDFLYESFLLFVKRNPLNILRVFYWLLTKRREFIKSRIADCVDVDVSLIPYNLELIEWLKTQKKAGREIVLATASHEKYAHAVADHLTIFSSVLATQEGTNLKGPNKANKLVELYGNKGFIYAGDSNADLNVWPFAQGAVVVTSSEKFTAKVEQVTQIYKLFKLHNDKSTLFKAMRVYQWVKNLLVFVPLLASHNLTNTDLLGITIIAFIAFSLCASSVYITNDLFDLAADRKHPSKCTRVFASGQMGIVQGWVLMGLCLVAAIALASTVSIEFLTILMVYYFITLFYSIYFKHIMMMDIVVLAGLYTLRIIAGAVAIKVVLSFWLLAFSIFIFLNLAIIKRYTELITFRNSGQTGLLKTRGYYTNDAEMLASLGAASGYISVLVMALYVNSSEVAEHYSAPEVLWVICLLLLFWVGRIWLLASRGKVDDDPIVFVMKDKASWISALLMLLLFLLAI